MPSDENNFDKSPDRRAWKKVSDLVKNISDLSERHIKLIAGIIGEETAVNFILTCRAEKTSQVKLDDFWNRGKESFNALLVLNLNEFSNFADKVFALLVPNSPLEKIKSERAKTFLKKRARANCQICEQTLWCALAHTSIRQVCETNLRGNEPRHFSGSLKR